MMEFKTCEQRVLAELETAENKVTELEGKLDKAEKEIQLYKNRFDIVIEVLARRARVDENSLSFGYIYSDTSFAADQDKKDFKVLVKYLNLIPVEGDEE